MAVLRLPGPPWQREHRSWVGLCSGWHSGRQRGAAQGGKTPVPAGTVSCCLHTFSHQSRRSTLSPTRSITARNPAMAAGCGICLCPPSKGCHTPGSGPRVPAPVHTQGQSRREHCWKRRRHCGQDLEVSGVTAQGTWHCHLQQHLGWGEAQGKGQMCWQLRGVLSLSSAPGQSCPHTRDASPGRQRGGRVLLAGRTSKHTVLAEKCEALGITALSHLGHVRIDSDPSL